MRKARKRPVRRRGPGLWERLDRTQVSARPRLSHEAIALAAVRLADAKGFEAVTLRGLAATLDVAPMALYRYVNSKEDVFALMVDAAHPPADMAATAGHWREILRTHAAQVRTTLLNHPWLLDLPPSAQMAITPRRFAALERALSSLGTLGLAPDAMMLAVESVVGFAHGTTAIEISRRRMMKSEGWTDGDDLRSGLSNEMSWLLGSKRYPTLERYIHEAHHRDDRDRVFERGLDCLLDGIGVQLGMHDEGGRASLKGKHR